MDRLNLLNGVGSVLYREYYIGFGHKLQKCLMYLSNVDLPDLEDHRSVESYKFFSAKVLSVLKRRLELE